VVAMLPCAARQTD